MFYLYFNLFYKILETGYKKHNFKVTLEEDNLTNETQLISQKKRRACKKFYRCNVSNKCPVKGCIFNKDEDNEVVIIKSQK